MSIAAMTSRTGAGAFDFLIGDWQVEHRRLRHRLAGDTEWLTFGGRTSARKILGGLGNIDENVIDFPGAAYEAVSLRLFQPADGQWSIWWVDGRQLLLTPPVCGEFDEAGVGTFFGDDTFEGRPIRVRFVWSAVTDRSAQWEQAFSADGGKNWETNWLMRFRRAA